MLVSRTTWHYHCFESLYRSLGMEVPSTISLCKYFWVALVATGIMPIVKIIKLVLLALSPLVILLYWLYGALEVMVALLSGFRPTRVTSIPEEPFYGYESSGYKPYCRPVIKNITVVPFHILVGGVAIVVLGMAARIILADWMRFGFWRCLSLRAGVGGTHPLTNLVMLILVTIATLAAIVLISLVIYGLVGLPYLLLRDRSHLIKHYFHAVKDKVCPMIRISDEPQTVQAPTRSWLRDRQSDSTVMSGVIFGSFMLVTMTIVVLVLNQWNKIQTNAIKMKQIPTVQYSESSAPEFISLKTRSGQTVRFKRDG